MIKRYRIHDLHCSGCAARLEDAFARLPGMLHASIDLDAATLRLEGNDRSYLNGPACLDELNRLADAIEPGTRIEICSPELSPEQIQAQPATSTQRLADAGPDMALWLLAGSAALLVFGLIFENGLATLFPPLLVKLIVYVVPYLVCGLPVLRKGGQSLLRKDFFNEFTLMGGATLAAVALGELPEAAGVMVFYCLGEYVQERAAGRSRRSIKALLASKPTVAHVLHGENEADIRDVSPESLTPGARLLVKPGEKIPLDGIVLTGRSHIDTSPLTGEPVPVGIAVGERVFAGTINLDGALTVHATAAFADSSVARIMEMVENATARKAPTERFITRFARYYTPVVVIGALLVALVPPLLGLGTFQEWLYRALVLLVISCPCALVISIPLGYFGGIGAASRQGILVKGGNVLDALRDIRTVAFDKTGTLTQGVFKVTHTLPAPGISPEELLQTAALAERHSNHPIARSVLQAANDLPAAETSTPMNVEEVAGKGLVAHVNGTRILAGNSALLADYGIAVASPGIPGTVVHVARDTALLGSLVIADVVRDDAERTVRRLHGMGLRVVMLTGDRPESAEPIANLLGLDGFQAGLLPQDKAAALHALGEPKTILFVGDGINDAPALASAGVSVAMGGLGAEAAVEIADTVILHDAPEKVVALLDIAQRTRVIVWQNIVLALSVKGVFMILGLTGLSGLWEAVFADVGVALLAVLNAARTMRPRA